ncbi:MAG: hypothetical protein ACLFWD_12415, partial [Anaerolineales bacterium]
MIRQVSEESTSLRQTARSIRTGWILLAALILASTGEASSSAVLITGSIGFLHILLSSWPRLNAESHASLRLGGILDLAGPIPLLVLTGGNPPSLWLLVM